MNTGIKKIICLVLSAIMIFSMFSAVHASDSYGENGENYSPDGTVKVTVLSNKEEYSACSIAYFYIVVENVSDETIRNISVEPVFYELQPVGRFRNTTGLHINKLEPGDSRTISFRGMLQKNVIEMSFLQNLLHTIIYTIVGKAPMMENDFDDGRTYFDTRKVITFAGEPIVQGARLWYEGDAIAGDGEDDVTEPSTTSPTTTEPTTTEPAESTTCAEPDGDEYEDEGRPDVVVPTTLVPPIEGGTETSPDETTCAPAPTVDYVPEAPPELGGGDETSTSAPCDEETTGGEDEATTEGDGDFDKDIIIDDSAEGSVAFKPSLKNFRLSFTMSWENKEERRILAVLDSVSGVNLSGMDKKICIVDNKKASGEDVIVKVTGVTGGGAILDPFGGAYPIPYTFAGTIPLPSEVFTSFDVSGRATENGSVKASSNAKIVNDGEPDFFGETVFKINKYNISGTVTVTAESLDYILRASTVGDELVISEAYAKLNADIKTDITYNKAVAVDRKISLGTYIVPIKSGFKARGEIFLEIKADGQVGVCYETSSDTGAYYNAQSGTRTVENTTATLTTRNFTGNSKIGTAITTELEYFNVDIFNMNTQLGGEITLSESDSTQAENSFYLNVGAITAETDDFSREIYNKDNTIVRNTITG